MRAQGNTPLPPLSSGSDEGTPSSEPAFLAVGLILRPHGLRGEVRTEIHTHYPERFALHQELYLGSVEAAQQGTCLPYRLEGHRFHKNLVLLKLGGIDDRNAADVLRGLWVWVPIDQAVPLQEGELYQYQMIGLNVVTEQGEPLGQVIEIIETGANLVYIVRGLRGEMLIPDTDEVVLQVDVQSGTMTVRLIEGLV